ncbi:MAG: twin-arginine translocase TatA/TatE family subunit [Sphingobacteriaceae bacterium]|nr:twin-arginine translocase TatA/TatE family subunit [Sphingobacteriaceae bacterium]
MSTITVLGFLNMGAGELIPIVLLVLLLFGGKKLPELARGLGKGIREFKDASEGVKREIHRNINSLDLDEELKAQEEQERKAKENVFHPTQPLDSKPIDSTNI